MYTDGRTLCEESSMFEGTCMKRYLSIRLVCCDDNDNLVGSDAEKDSPKIENTNTGIVLCTLQVQSLFEAIQPSIGNCILIQFVPVCNPSVVAQTC